MSQVGTINGYHDGSTYSLADIYDEKLIEYNILAGTSAKEILSVSFNTETGAEFVYDSDVVADSNINLYQSTTLIASSSSSTKPLTKMIPYLSTDHASSGYALNFETRQLLLGYNTTLVPLTKDSSGNYVKSIVPSYEFEGRFFIDTSKSSSITKINGRVLYSVPVTTSKDSATTTNKGARLRTLGYYYSDSTAGFYLRGISNYDKEIYVRELDRSVFDSPFHFRLQFFNSIDNPKYIYLCYINDELYFYAERATADQDTEYYFYQLDSIAIGAYRIYNTTTSKYETSKFVYISVTDFKASLLSPVYQKISVPGNMLIRHNNANRYVPLTTDKSLTSTPCLAIRHNNTNYYAIK